MSKIKVLLTGGGGMVGRNLLEHPGIGELDILAPRRSELDLRNFTAVENYMQKYQPDMVIHAAGKVGGIQANLREPVSFLLDNLDMGRNIVLASYQAGVKRLINLGSSCMYPRNYLEPLCEEMVLKGELEQSNEGYALAKIVTARLCSYVSLENIHYKYKTLIPCNIYGSYDNFDPSYSHLVPAIIHKIYEAKLSGSPVVEVWGDGTARREFMHASDLADCIIESILRFDTLPDVMNVGVGVDASINEYYKTVAEIIGYSGQFNHDLTKPVGLARKLVSIKKVQAWGWYAKVFLRDGIEKTYAHYLQLRNGKS